MRTSRASLLIAAGFAIAGCVSHGFVDPTAHVEPREDLRSAFTDRHVDGAFVLDASDAPNVRIAVNEPLARQAYLPASTFKIMNSLVALETGVAPDLDFALKWDGVVRDVPEWNRDLTMREAFRVSAVWFFQEVARRIGHDRMQAWIDRADYGNRDIGGNIDSFWLDGALRITAMEQVGFLDRLERHALPFSRRSQDLVLEEMKLDEKDGRILRGKTGWTGRTKPSVGWFVGIVEEHERFACFATLLVNDEVDAAFLPARRAISEEILHELGWW